jgi:hypothetical protein
LQALAAQAEASAAMGFRFTDVTSQAGLHFEHNSGAFGGKFLPETLGSGCAFLDYDRDGWQDLLLINGTDWPGHKKRRTTLLSTSKCTAWAWRSAITTTTASPTF